MKDTSRVGQASEGIVLAAFASRGYPVLVPFGNAQRYDLAFEHNGKLYRVQCKTGRIKDAKHDTLIAHTADNNGRSYVGQVEFLAVVYGIVGNVYLLRPEKIGGQTLHLRLDPSRVKSKKVRYAEDYLLDRVLEREFSGT